MFIWSNAELFYENILPKYQFGFCKGYIAQHCLIALIEKWKQNVNDGGAFRDLMRDLPKAFDCLSHEFLMAKFDALVLIKSL